MYSLNYTFFTIFCIVVFMISVDKNVADYLIILPKLIKVNFERLKFLIILHPMNPITTWKMNRRANRIAKELQREFGLKDNS